MRNKILNVQEGNQSGPDTAQRKLIVLMQMGYKIFNSKTPNPKLQTPNSTPQTPNLHLSPFLIIVFVLPKCFQKFSNLFFSWIFSRIIKSSSFYFFRKKFLLRKIVFITVGILIVLAIAHFFH